MHVRRATHAPGPAAVAQGAGAVFRQDLFGAEAVEQALADTLSDMDAESAEDFMRALGAIGQTAASAAPAFGQGAAAGSVAGPYGALIGGAIGVATHLAQNPPGRRPTPRRAAPPPRAPAPPMPTPAPPAPAPPPPAPPAPAPAPAPPAPAAANAAALIAALQDPAVRQTILSLLGAPAPSPAPPEPRGATEWLVGSGVARPLGAP